METTNERYNRWGTIDCLLNHPRFGWIPYTVDPIDNPDLYALVLAKNPAEYVPPVPEVIDWGAVDTQNLNAALAENGSIVRALALLVLDELNAHAAKITAILNAADTATSLDTFKTAMLAITDAPQHTRLQLVAALKAKIR